MFHAKKIKKLQRLQLEILITYHAWINR